MKDKKKRTFSSDKVPSSSSVASSSSTSASSGQSWADKVKGNSFERRESVSEVSGQGKSGKKPNIYHTMRHLPQYTVTPIFLLP